MKFSEQWLREWIGPEPPREQLLEQLNMAGLEVDDAEPVAPEFEGVVVGEVVSLEPHPDADKLRVCQVNAGGDELLNIVCGAPNVYAGMRAPVAVVGAKLPDDFKIKKAKLRGVASFGMLCSARELGLSEDHEGLFELPKDAPVGEDLRAWLQLEDISIDVDLTPNRGDCLGVIGIARELSAINRIDMKSTEVPAVPAQIEDTFPIELLHAEACPRYAGRIIRGINPKAKTPLWMQERLRRCGLRSISPTVDVTNYVMMEMGKPIHAFDFNKLSGGIRVRAADDKEELTLLDGQQLTLDDNTLVIADHQAAHAMAGIMGGLDSSVTDETHDIYLESAWFSPLLMAGCARRYGMHTDASHRFERSVDPHLCVPSIERATALLLDIVGGQPGPVTVATTEEYLPKQSPITLRASRIEWLLGDAVPAEVIDNGLSRLGLAVTAQGDGQWQVTPPSFRADITQEADLIEEVGRLYGYNNLPNDSGTNALKVRQTGEFEAVRRLQNVLVQRAYQEAITYSFVNPDVQNLLLPETQGMTLANPMSSEQSVMRTTLWSSLLEAIAYNRKRQQPIVRLFETGLRFVCDDEGNLNQDRMIAGVICGDILPEQWGEKTRRVDFFDLKGDVEALLSVSGEGDTYIAAEHPSLHPGQTARVERNGETLGYLGALHPRVAKALDLPENVFLFELKLEPLCTQTHAQAQPLSKFPSVRRDIALIVEETVQAADVIACIRENSGTLLTNLQLFDIYRGESIDSGKKSLALGLIFRASSRNLIEEEIDEIMSQVVEKLKQKFKALLRD